MLASISTISQNHTESWVTVDVNLLKGLLHSPSQTERATECKLQISLRVISDFDGLSPQDSKCLEEHVIHAVSQ